MGKFKATHYCCLYHYVQGKSGTPSTPCYSHVPLGVINPITTSKPQPNQFQPDLGLQGQANKYNIQNHTHFPNQIEGKESLPKRLVYPRVYVQKINPKYTYKVEHYYPNPKRDDFSETQKLFRKLAANMDINSKSQIGQLIENYMNRNGLEPNEQMLVSKSHFINFLLECKFSQQEAEQMWMYAYNQHRYIRVQRIENTSLARSSTEHISMQAFIFNFKKYYLDDQIYYRNCFSEKALRQRLIDLRIILQPWFLYYKILKFKMRDWTLTEINVCDQLLNKNQNSIYEQFIDHLQQRNAYCAFMRIVAKCFYPLTDQKNVGLQKINNRVAALIDKKTAQLQNCNQFLREFKAKHPNPSRITELIEFLDSHYRSEPSIAKWLRGLFQYLYIYKRNPNITLNTSTFQLSCQKIIEINVQLLDQYMCYRQQKLNDQVNELGNFIRQVNSRVDQMPELQGHKKFLVECNYVAESILRVIRNKDASCCFRVINSLRAYSNDQINLQILQQALNQDLDPAYYKYFWRDYFTWQQNCVVNQGQQSKQKDNKIYQAALYRYELANENNPVEKKNYSKYKTKVNEIKSTKYKVHSPRLKTQEPNQCNEHSEHYHTNSQDQEKKYNYHYCYCSKCDLIIKSTISTTIGQVEEYADYLAQLLKE